MLMPRPPRISMASLMMAAHAFRAWYLMMAEATDRVFTAVHRGRGETTDSIQDVGGAGNTPQYLADPLELADGHLELFSDGRIGANAAADQSGRMPCSVPAGKWRARRRGCS